MQLYYLTILKINNKLFKQMMNWSWISEEDFNLKQILRCEPVSTTCKSYQKFISEKQIILAAFYCLITRKEHHPSSLFITPNSILNIFKVRSAKHCIFSFYKTEWSPFLFIINKLTCLEINFIELQILRNTL